MVPHSVARRFQALLHSLVMLVAAASSAGARTELLAFSSPHCGPCQQLKPALERLAQEGYPIRTVDVTREVQLARQFHVDRVPTLVMVTDGREVLRQQGAHGTDGLRRMFAAAGVRPQQAGRSDPKPRWASDNPAAAVFPASLSQPGVEGTQTPGPARQAGPTGAPQPANVDSSQFEQQLIASSVRITVRDATGQSYGTGTIIDTREGDALIVTCGHLFRGAASEGEISIELFTLGEQGPQVVDRVAGHLESHDLDRDVGLVSFRASKLVSVAPVAAEFQEAVNDRVWSVGCDRGAAPSIRSSRVTAIDRYHGPPNIETSGAPVEGRSGGGLFNERGELIGVCFAADNEGDEGLYAGLASIQVQLDELGLQDIYAANHAAVADSRAVVAAPQAMASLPTAALPVVRGQDPGATTSPAVFPTVGESPPLPPIEQAALEEIASRGMEAEVVVIVRPREPGAASEVIKLDRVSPEFVQALRSLPAAR